MDLSSQFSDFAARLTRFFPICQSGLDCTLDDEKFRSLAVELFRVQFAANLPYRAWCEAHRATPQTVASWKEIPALPVAAFKEMDVTCLPQPERKHVFCSSGTTGRGGSRHYHSDASLRIYAAACWHWFSGHLLPESFSTPPTGAMLLCLTPDGQMAPTSSLVHMFEVVRRHLKAPPDAFAGCLAADGGWELDMARVNKSLQEAIVRGNPICLLGTAFSFVHLLDGLEKQHLRLSLPPGSRIMETGGYKGRSRELTRAKLHANLSARLGVPSSLIVSEYGMSELSSQAYDAVAGTPVKSQGLFRFPPWVRVRIINPETGREAAEGEPGLIWVLDLANVYSVMALQTEDLGRQHGDGFELLGRAQAAEPRGCSLMLR